MESCEYTVMAAGPERDEVIVKNWREQWLANGRPSGAWTADQMEKMMAHIAAARTELQHLSFVAVSRSGEVIGSGACQLWSGPMPATHERVGTCWGVFVKPEWRRKGVATQLMSSICNHWRSIGCQRGVLLCASDEARRVYERLGFGAGNMLLHDLSSPSEPAGDLEHLVVEPAGADADGALLRHWRLSLFKAGGWASEMPDNLEANAAKFIKRARDKLEFQSFVARDPAGAVVGSACCQVWEGPGSNNASWQKLIKIGVVWNLYVAPEYRERGVEAKLLERVVGRWKEIGCTKGFASALCDDDAAVLARLGFTPQNAMVVELGRASSPCSPIDLRRFEAARRPTATRATETLLADGSLTHEELSFNASVRKSGAELALTMSDAKLASLRLALPQMIDAALPDSKAGAELKEAAAAAQREAGVHVSGEWYTQRIVKFGGGFDMKKLTAQPGKLAEKFDRLSTKYDEWSVGNRCSYYDWLARMSASARGSSLLGSGATVLDVACGIGLPAHMLRLCGFEGSIAGTDISSGMLDQARRRRVYDRLFVANANEGLDVAPSSVDLVVCVGAMELLDHVKVLGEFARILKPGGRLWATFQWEGATDDEGNALAHPTAHQNVTGVSLELLTAELAAAGFDVGAATIEKTTCAFLTPSPAQDGSVLPVPYLYVSAGLAA